jgi:hypothetical protein
LGSGDRFTSGGCAGVDVLDDGRGLVGVEVLSHAGSGENGGDLGQLRKGRHELDVTA